MPKKPRMAQTSASGQKLPKTHEVQTGMFYSNALIDSHA